MQSNSTSSVRNIRRARRLPGTLARFCLLSLASFTFCAHAQVQPTDRMREALPPDPFSPFVYDVLGATPSIRISRPPQREPASGASAQGAERGRTDPEGAQPRDKPTKETRAAVDQASAQFQSAQR